MLVNLMLLNVGDFNVSECVFLLHAIINDVMYDFVIEFCFQNCWLYMILLTNYTSISQGLLDDLDATLQKYWILSVHE